jgi:hypothetical protein
MEAQINKIIHLLVLAIDLCSKAYDSSGRHQFKLEDLIKHYTDTHGSASNQPPHKISFGSVDVAQFLGLTAQSLSNFKAKGVVPHKNINTAFLFLKWPINSLLEGNIEEFLSEVLKSQAQNKIFEDDETYSFKDIVERIQKALKELCEETDTDLLTMTEQITEGVSVASDDDPYRKILLDNFYESDALQVIFKHSKLVDHQSHIIFNKLRESDIPRVSENNKILFLDRFDFWMYMAQLKSFVKEEINMVNRGIGWSDEEKAKYFKVLEHLASMDYQLYGRSKKKGND